MGPGRGGGASQADVKGPEAAGGPAGRADLTGGEAAEDEIQEVSGI